MAERSTANSFDKKLVNIIHQTAKLAINVGVDLEAFDALSPEDQVLLGKYPYTLAARWLVGIVHQWNKNAEPVQYFFDRVGPKEGKAEVEEEVDRLKEDRYYITGCYWANSYRVTELQAADIIVYEYGKEGANNLGRTAKHREMRKSAVALVKAKTAPPIAQEFYDANRLQRAVRLLKKQESRWSGIQTTGWPLVTEPGRWMLGLRLRPPPRLLIPLALVSLALLLHLVRRNI